MNTYETERFGISRVFYYFMIHKFYDSAIFFDFN